MSELLSKTRKPTVTLCQIDEATHCYIRSLTVAESLEIQKIEDAVEQGLQAIAKSVCDEAGNPIFTREDIVNLPNDLVNKLAEAIKPKSDPNV